MLPRTLDELYSRTRGFRILVKRDGIAEEVIASSHLDLFSDTLAEVKSLAVKESYLKQGLGKLMVEDCETEAKELGIKKIFALTYKEKFFEKLGYKVIDIKTLPEKVFKECVICPFYEDCNEIAVLKYII